MLQKILPDKFYDILDKKVNLKAVNEIRLRADRPVVVCVNGRNYFLSENGLTSNLSSALYASKIIIEDVVFRASECSIYSVNEQIKRGFIITDEAVRIGLGGNLIEENKQIKTMTNYTSVNIRVPHFVKNCSLNAFTFIANENGIKNTLVISPPGCGKTTFLKDFVYQLSIHDYKFNVLLLDERGELDVALSSNFTDKIAFASKKIGIENGIRSLSPDIIVTDELGIDEDIDAIYQASSCGVNILASCHAQSIEEFAKKPLFATIIKDKVFKRYVLLSKRNGPGTFEGIYDENFSRIYR